MTGTAAGFDLTRAEEGSGPWPQRLRRTLAAVLEGVAAEPDAAGSAAMDNPALETEGRRRYRDALDRLETLLGEGREYAPPAAALPPDHERMAVAGIETAISGEVAAGRTQQLPNLLPDLLFTLLTPYVGPEAASAEVHRGAKA
jgi:hypothetical protein